jgi:uncharacterized protein YggU (UPF0235/DUF167 family)
MATAEHQMPKIKVQVHPRSKKPRIEEINGVLHIYISEMPIENKANAAVIKALASLYHLAKSRITLTAGHKSKNKTFEIS